MHAHVCCACMCVAYLYCAYVSMDGHVCCACMYILHACVLYVCMPVGAHVCLYVVYACVMDVWCGGQVEFEGFFNCFTSCLCDGVDQNLALMD